ncbi:MAG: Tad domain-containing protein [bacterium]|nr:Tad domain-containing protein [bacterium]
MNIGSCSLKSNKSTKLSGQAMVIVAIAVIVLVIAAGMGVDLGYIYLSRNSLQNMTDAAALAGAQGLPSSYDARQASAACYARNISPANPPIPQFATPPAGADPNASYYTIGSDEFQAITPYTIPGNQRPASQIIKVKARRQLHLFFMPLINIRTFTVSAEASSSKGAGSGGAGRGLIVLNPDAYRALQITGNARVRVPNGSAIIQSDNSQALYIDGSSEIHTRQTYIVGGWAKNKNAPVVLDPAPLTNQPPLSDPLADLTAPSTQGLPVFSGITIPYSSSAPPWWINELTLQPGVYTGKIILQGDCRVTFAPGVYILQNGITITASAQAFGSGVMFYNAGGVFDSSGNSRFYVTPPTSGLYEGMLVFQARNNTSEMLIRNSTGWSEHGTIYLPSATLSATGDVQYTMDMVIANKVNVRNSCSLNINAVEPGATGGATGGITLEE